MARSGSGESHRGRYLALAGGGVTLAAAIGGVLWWRYGRQEPHEDVGMVWGVPMENLEEAVDRVATAQFPLGGNAFKDHLGVIQTEAAPYDERLQASRGLAAVAIRDRASGLWVAGVAPEGSTWGRPEDDENRRHVAVHVGSPAISEAVIGVADEGEFIAFPTETVMVADRATITDDYPTAPILGRPPVLLG